MVEMYEEDAVTYSFTDLDHDGHVDDMELREVYHRHHHHHRPCKINYDDNVCPQYLLQKKREGVMRKDIDTRVTTLMAKYDSQARHLTALYFVCARR